MLMLWEAIHVCVPVALLDLIVDIEMFQVRNGMICARLCSVY